MNKLEWQDSAFLIYLILTVIHKKALRKLLNSVLVTLEITVSLRCAEVVLMEPLWLFALNFTRICLKCEKTDAQTFCLNTLKQL